MGENFAGAGKLGRSNALGAMALALVILALDVLSPLQGAVAVLYTTVVLLAARSRERGLILVAGLTGAALAMLAYVLTHWADPLGSPAMRLGVSLVAIAITTVLCVRNLAAFDRQLQAVRRYRAIFDAAGVPIWETDFSATHARMRAGTPPEDLAEFTARQAVVRDINQAALEMFGVAERGAMIGATIFRFRTDASLATLGRIVRGLHAGETTIHEETRFRNSSGELLDVILRVTLPADHDGWKRVLVMALDVTERNRTQARLDQSQAELAHVSRVNLLGQLGASIAHEVNQPLSAIITYAKSGKRWLAQEAPGATEVADCLEHIGTNGNRAAEIIARIRDMSRKVDPRSDAFELAPLIEETVALLRRDLQSHEVAIEVQASPGLPSVLGDRVQIQQVLMNLMLNADEAMGAVGAGAKTRADPRPRSLHLSAVPEGDGVLVEIRDTGPGIAGDPEALFASFYTTKRDGMGMGLSICRNIVARYGGRLAAANHPDGGAVFSFALPAQKRKG